MANIEACLVYKGDVLNHGGGSFRVRQVRHCLHIGVTLWVAPVCARAREIHPVGLKVIAVRPTVLLARVEEDDAEQAQVA